MEYIASVFVPLPSLVSKRILRAKKIIKLDYDTLEEPHVTLYFAKFKKANFKKFVEAIKSLKINPIWVVLSGPKATENKAHKNQFIFCEVKNRKDIYILHREILFIGNKFRNNLIRKKDLQKIKTGFYSKEEIKNLQTFGYSRVLRLFKPHITLGETGSNNHKNVLKSLNKELNFLNNYQFTPKYLKVGFYEKREKTPYKALEKIDVQIN